MISFEELPNLLNGKSIGKIIPGEVKFISIDSRNILVTPNTLFFAIEGERNDGHKFISQLYEKGIRNFVVKSDFDASYYPEAGFILVKDVVEALQRLSAYKRSQFNIPVVGITGSNGKTIVKEWLAEIAGARWHVVKSPKSYNSQVGVPLSVWQLEPHNELAIFEAGISHPGEMERLKNIIRPTIGIFTNIGSAHDENFESRLQKAEEKLRLFENSEKLIYQSDDPILAEAVTKSKGKFEHISWSRKKNACYRAPNLIKSGESTTIYLSKGDFQYRFIVPFTDDSSLQNVIHCIVATLELGLDAESIQKKIASINTIAMRMAIKNGIHGCTIIDDTYNNDLAGLETALDFLNNQKLKKKKTLILSDILESGLSGECLAQRIHELVKVKGVERFIGVGNTLFTHKDTFKGEVFMFKSTSELLSNIEKLEFRNEIILVKGARIFKFEKIVGYLQEKIHGTTLEINLEALIQNLNFYKSCLNPGTKIMAMVKAFSYGSGAAEIASQLQYHRVNYLAVAYADEGIALRESGISIPILVLNPEVEVYQKMLKHHLEPEIYSLNSLNKFIRFWQEKGNPKLAIHLKIDTGMHRLGFDATMLEELCATLKRNKELRVASVFTHLVAAENEDHDGFTNQQINEFNEAFGLIRNALGYSPDRHVLNTAGILRFPDAQFEMVRLGIGLYGIETSGWEAGKLQNVSTLRTTISQIKNLKKGETVGYNRSGVINAENATIATIAIGYADGFSRRLGNGNGNVLVKGKKAPTIGFICMDMCMIDVSGIDVNEGDEVILFNENLKVKEMADAIGTIPYEVLTGIGGRVKRVFFTG